MGSIIYLRALQGHSGNNLIDPTLQDNVLIAPGVFPYIYHVGSTFNLHSIISNGLIPGGQDLSRRQSVFFLPVDPRKEDHRDPEYIDYSAPRLARYLQNAWKRHQDTVFWVDIDLGNKEGLVFYQTRSNAIILEGTLPAHCIVRAERLRNGEKLYEKQDLSPRPPPKISLNHDLNWTKGNDQGSTVEHQPVRKLQSLGETLLSILSNGLIPGGQELNGRQSVFFLPIDPRDEDHRDPETVDYSVPRRARYVQNSWKRHQDTVFWIDIDLGIIKEGLKFYQTRSNAIILQVVLPPSCIVRAERLRNGEKLFEKQYLSPRPPPKISLKHDLNWNQGKDQGSTVEHRPVVKFVQQSLGETLQSSSSKPIQFPKPIEDRTVQPVIQEIVGKLQEELSSSDGSGQPDREEEKRVLKNHDTSEQPDREERLHKVQEDCHLKKS